MANFFKTRYLVLNRQLLDASGNSLYLNGVEIGSLISGNLTLTGAALLSVIAQTGQAAWTHGQNNALNLSGSIANTGSQAWNAANNNAINLSGRDTAISGALEGRIALTGQAAWTHGQNNALNLSGRLFQTGSILDNKINSLSGWVAPASPYYVYTTGQQDIVGRKNFLTGISISGDGLDFTHTGKPAYLEGRVFYDYDEHTLAYYNDADDITINVAQENVIRVKNTTLNTITNGMAVYVSGAQGMRPLIYPAIASNDEAVDRILGIATHDIPAGQNGYVTTLGLVHDLNLTGFLEGDEVFLSPTISGGYTSLAPDKPNLVVKLGVVLHNGQANGILYTNPETAESHLQYLHDIWINQSTLANNNLLIYNSFDGYWKNVPSFSGLLESGYRSSDISLSGNLYQTGSDLFNRDASISGGLEARIRATGQAAWISSNGANIDISGRINASGRRAWDDAINISGRLALSGSILDTYIRFVSGNLISTGQTAQNNALNLSGSINVSGRRAWDDAINLSGRLFTTGSILDGKINSLSGSAEGIFVHRTGNENISGEKYFINNIAIGAPSTTTLLQVGNSSVATITIKSSGNGNPGGLNFIRERAGNGAAQGASIFLNSNPNTTDAFLYLQTQSANANIGDTGSLTPANGVRLVLAGGRGVANFEYGNLAIGTFVPQQNLHVTGGIRTDFGFWSGATNIADIFATELELTLTGQHIINNAINLSGNLNATGRRAWDDAINLSGRLFATGSLIAGVSGGLQVQISSNDSDISTLKTNLNATGRRAWDDAINLSGRLFATGALIAGVSGGLQAQISSNDSDISTLSNRITSTGQNSRNDALNLSGSLSQTGATLLGLINTANVTAANAVYTTGTQFISGQKYFIGNTFIDNLYVTGTQFIVNTQDMYVADNWIVLNSTGGARDSAIFVSTGLTGLNATGAIFGFDVPSNTWRFGLGSQQTDLLFLPRVASGEDIDALNTRLIQTGYGLSVHVSSISGNINASGRRAWDDAINLSGRLFATGALIAGVSGGLQVQISSNDSDISTLRNNLTLTGQHGTNNAINLSGNLFSTGASLQSQVSSNDSDISTLKTNLNATGRRAWDDAINLSGRLTQTGVLIGQEIDALSGVLNTINGNVVWTTGNQSIGGAKTFTSLLNVTGTNILIQHDNATLRLATTTNPNTYDVKLVSNHNSSQGLQLFGTASRELMRYNWSDSTLSLMPTGGQYVSIGTPTATERFQVSGGNILLSNGNALRFYNKNGVNVSVLALTSADNFQFGTISGTTQAFFNSANGFYFYTGDGTSPVGSVMVVRGNGNVSIGSNFQNSLAKLHVSGGDIRVEGAYLSGATNIADIFATKFELLTSGRRAWDDAINLSGRLFATGALIANVSGGLQAQINSNDSDITSLSNRITSTGQGSRNDALNLSGNLNATGRRAWDDAVNLSGRLTITGQTLINISNSISGWVDNFYVHRFGKEAITGTKSFMVGNIGIGTLNPIYNLEVTGSFAAASKSFVIPHPLISGKRLQHGVVEGPEHSIFIRGRLINSGTIQLPDYWSMMVDKNSITVQLTPIGGYQKLYVDEVSSQKIIIKNGNFLDKKINCFYYVQGERTDIEKLKVTL